MNQKIVAILIIAFSYTSKSVKLMNGVKTGTAVIGELEKIYTKIEANLRRNDDRIKMICSHLTELSDNHDDKYKIARFVAKKNIPTICHDMESDQNITDGNKLTREVQQLNGNYRFEQEFSESRKTIFEEGELMKREIPRISGTNKVDMSGRPETPQPGRREMVTPEVNKPDEEVKEATTASNEETVGESKTEKADLTKDVEEHVEEQNTTSKSSVSEDEKMPSDITKSSNSDEQVDSEKTPVAVVLDNDEISSSITEFHNSESSEYSDESTKSSVSTDEDIASSKHVTPHLSAPSSYDETSEVDEDYEEDSEDKGSLSSSNREDVNTFISKLDHILESSGDFIIALLMKNYKLRMKIDHTNEKFWNKVRETTKDINGNVVEAKNLVQKEIKAQFGRPFVRDIASTLKSFVDDIEPEYRRAY